MNHEKPLNSNQIDSRVNTAKKGIGMDIREIQNILPHRYPFLLIDRVIEMEGYQRAVGIKNVTVNEPYFQGHFPGMPVMPGVLQVEAMSQLAGALLLSRSGNEKKLAVLLSIDEAKFRRSVIPGDQLRIEVETIKVKARIIQVDARILVEGEIVSEAKIKFMLVDKDKIVQNTLRFRDEFVRHKILDLLGDLYLLNASLIGRIIATKSGHKQNIQFVAKLAELMNN